MTTPPAAHVITGDAFNVVPTLPPLQHVFTSMPDAAEVGMHADAWATFFHDCARLVVDHLEPHGYAVFYQTDRRHLGRLHDKAAMVAHAALEAGARVVWHKIAIRTTGTSLFRPGYTHLVAVSHRGTAGRPTPDVFHAGRKQYADATDEAALAVALDFLASKGADHITDPFAGRGSIAAAAARRGIASTSIEIDPAQADAAVAHIAAHRTTSKETA